MASSAWAQAYGGGGSSSSGGSAWAQAYGGGGGTSYSSHTGADLQRLVDNALHGGSPSFLHSAEHLGTDFLAGIYGTGRAAVIDVKNNPESLATGPAAPFTANLISLLRGHGGGHLTKDIAIPTGLAYKNKYYSRDVLHNIKEDPFGTLLDAAALGTIPIGAEGLEIRAGTLAARLGDSEAGFARALAKAGGPDTKLGRAVIRKAAAAAKKQEPYDIHYTPEGAEGATFKASRARTVQGRYVYNPLRDALGRAGGGQLKWFGDAARLAKFQAAERDLNLAGDYQAAHDFNTAIGANLRPSKRLRKEEQIALPLLAEYGPETAQQAELGAPRLQRVEFYHEKIAETEQALAKIEGKSRRDKQRRTLRSILKAQKRMLGILTDTKLSPKIDEAIKTPRPVLQEVLGAADTLAEEQGKILVEAGHATPEILEARRHAPQYVLHGYTLGPADEEGVRSWMHPDTFAGTPAAAAQASESIVPSPLTQFERVSLPSEVSSAPATFSLRLPRLFYDEAKDQGKLGGHHFETVSQTSGFVRVRMDEAAFRHLERVARGMPQTSTVRSALRRIDQQRGVMEAAVEKTRQRLRWKTDETGMWHVEGSPDYLVVPSEHAYEAYRGEEKLGEDVVLADAKRRIERDVARRKRDLLQEERVSASAEEGDPFMSALDPQKDVSIKEEPVSDVNTWRKWRAYVPGREKHVGELIVYSYKGKRGYGDAAIRHPEGEIYMAEVDPEFRRQGIGTELFNRAQHEMPEIHHSTNLSEDAQAWIPSLDSGGPKSLEQIRAEHPDARYYPHMGPKLNAEGGRVRFGLTPKTPNIAMRNEGVRLSTGHIDLGPRAYSRAFAQALSLKATNLALEQLKPLMIPTVDGRAGKGYALVNPHKVSLSRFEREQGDVRDQFENLTDQEHAERMQQELDQLFPQAAHTAEEKKQLMQVPEEFVKRIRKDYTQTHWVIRKLMDFPLTVWKALVLKYRPAWLVNNILGQHLLLLLHHPFGWRDYVASLTPQKRKELSRGIYNLGGTGTVELVRDRTFKDAGFESSLRGRIKSGEKGGIAGKALYRLPSWPYRIVKGFGDGMAKANLSIADNQTRLTLGRHYVKDYRDRTRLKEIIAGFDDANAALKASAVKGKSLEQIAAEMPTHEKIELLRKVNSALGNFNTLHSTQGKWLRRAIPFAAWFKVILEISRDLLIEHPEKVWLIHNLEVAARKNPEVTPQFDVPSWFVGSLVAPWFGAKPGEDALISTNTANPFATPQQLLDQISVLTRSGTPSGQQSPSSALGPGMEAWNLLQGFDPFYGGEYTGPGDKSPGYQRVALGIAAGLPPVRLANEAGVPLTGKYHEPQSYRDRFINIGGRDFPLDALLRYLGLPLRRANRAKLIEYANRGL